MEYGGFHKRVSLVHSPIHVMASDGLRRWTTLGSPVVIILVDRRLDMLKTAKV